MAAILTADLEELYAVAVVEADDDVAEDEENFNESASALQQVDCIPLPASLLAKKLQRLPVASILSKLAHAAGLPKARGTRRVSFTLNR